MSNSLNFAAISEPLPGAKWKARWDWSWPSYEAWWIARGGDSGPAPSESVQALARYMPELVQAHAQLTELAGATDRVARFLSGWCPPAYLGGCTLAAYARNDDVRLVRNYDLSPDLNEGLLFRSEWTGRPVMGMMEFLWGLSDGMNDAGLCVALAYGGRGTLGRGFGITMIVRYLLEVCGTVDEAVAKLQLVPSHMAYNVVLADAAGKAASVELLPGGGLRRMPTAVATNHQSGFEHTERPAFIRTMERHSFAEQLIESNVAPDELGERFLYEPLYQREYAKGFGTLFTADYNPVQRNIRLLWPNEEWVQYLDDFREGTRWIRFGEPAKAAWQPFYDPDDWASYGIGFASCPTKTTIARKKM